jgi:hypothetical protein
MQVVQKVAHNTRPSNPAKSALSPVAVLSHINVQSLSDVRTTPNDPAQR